MTLSIITRALSSNIPQWMSCQGAGLKSMMLFVGLLAATAYAGPREQALQIHNRVAGVPPTEAVLIEMAELLKAGINTTPADKKKAVELAMVNEAFYSVTLKNMVTPWTNEAQTVFAPLNDYTATVIGMVRDDIDFRTLFSVDYVYVGKNSPAYDPNNNDHYAALENGGYSLKTDLEQQKQTYIPPEARAGVMTTRAAAAAFFSGGTNRAMFRFTLMNHMCRDLEQVHDTTRVPDYIRQDVSRSPGGDSRVFLNGCIGCHNGMDPLAKAFAYYDYVYDAENDPDGLLGSISYNTDGTIDPKTGTRVKEKYLINSTTFPYGFVTDNDSWKNYWREGPNSNLGWGAGTGAGTGAKSMGEELANSQAFASCQVEKVFKQVCMRKPANKADHDEIATITESFKTNGGKLKQVFVDTAYYCKGI